MDEASSERLNEMALMRREMDRDTRERLRTVEARLDHLEHSMTTQIHEVMLELRTIVNQQKEQGPALDTLNSLVKSGLALRWMVVGVVGILATLATAFTAWEAIKKWLP